LEEPVASNFRAEKYATQEISMKQAASNAGFLLGLFFFPEDGGNMFLGNTS
jgi:hypothetical protein